MVDHSNQPSIHSTNSFNAFGESVFQRLWPVAEQLPVAMVTAVKTETNMENSHFRKLYVKSFNKRIFLIQNLNANI